MAHIGEQLVKITRRVDAVLRDVKEFYPVDVGIDLNERVAGSEAELLHVQNEDIGHYFQSLQPLCFFVFALIAFYFHLFWLLQ